jgi:NhaP-type Na+/H+ or K+/H+ antiporter
VEFGGIAVVAGFVVAYSLVSRRLETTPITGPLVFVVAGILIGETGLELIEPGMEAGPVRVLAEATLVVLLFTDAIRIDLARLRRQIDLPARLLGIGLPLTVAAGTAAGLMVLPGFGIWEAALLAAVLAPTDAALGQAVVSNERVPRRIRQALNVESGLNDGLALPVVTVFLALAAAGVALETPGYWTGFAVAQIGVALAVGAVVGYGGGRLIDSFAARNWIDGAFRQLATLAVGVGAFALAEQLRGNGFVAAFVAGLAFGQAAREHCRGAYDFAEDEGQLLALLTFLVFGAALAGPALDQLTWRIGLYAVASLTLVRMLPVAVAMLGRKLKPPTIAYLGWFGPRGLASILFALIVVEEAALPIGDELLLVVTWTVLLSVALHGLSAFPLSERYAAWFAERGRPDMAEAVEVEMMPTR